MMNLLVYGDSNSWGYLDNGTGLRYEHRWTQIMQQEISYCGQCFVSQDCLPGRTVATDDPEFGAHFNGMNTVLSSVLAHSPNDHILLMLGTNSLKKRIKVSALDICTQLIEMADVILQSGAGGGAWHDCYSPSVTIMCPPILGLRSIDPDWINYDEWLGARDKSLALPGLLKQATQIKGVDYFDTNEIVQASNKDPIHLSPENHHRLGKAMANHVLNLPFNSSKM
ncbi:arylesterase [Alphaproteobacteria bacterium]|jgi:lysophospholipase L1-like esterase|nr:arylesterase [Alphaproteobacteria bacterium]MBT5799041.1 arylesterase [Alphaproteobacteria bacterium]MDA9189844.1 arylesterase [Alphaproteobacteria bacterium]MDC0394323.1 arylesterase [Alphaproteobacteria bacterium]MDC0461613.1 arylesterase [Alphaproteobacteria bacterium]